MEKYQVQDLIGSGAFSKVYRAIHIPSGTFVALKIIDKSGIDAHFIKQEIEIAQMLDHPFIVRTFEVFEDKKNVILIMEYIQGICLTEKITAGNGLSENECKNIFSQVVIAIQYLHQTLRIVHRDLKTDNIMITPNGIVKIIDFGFSHFMNEQMKTSCGSVAYTPPEMILRKPYGFGVDVWSAGVILYTMLYGKYPFIADNVGKVMQTIVESEPQYFPLRQQSTSIISQMLTKDPDKRATIAQITVHPWLSTVNLFGEHFFKDLDNRSEASLDRDQVCDPVQRKVSKSFYVNAEVNRQMDRSLKSHSCITFASIGHQKKRMDLLKRQRGVLWPHGNIPITGVGKSKSAKVLHLTFNM